MKNVENILRRHVPGLRTDVSLAGFTSFGIGGDADFYVEPDDIRQVSLLSRICSDHGLRLRILGAGTNLLVDDDGVDGLVIRLNKFDQVTHKGHRVIAGVGTRLPRLIHSTLDWNLDGLSALSGIPGSVGGALATNAGTRSGDIGPAISNVTGIDRRGRVLSVSADKLGLAYRTADLHGMIVTDVTFALRREPASNGAERVRNILAERKSSQPMPCGSAGCIFRNPPGDSAGRLIDRAGLKGRRRGGAQVSEKHANFIINTGDASAADVLALMRTIAKSVKEKNNIELEPEVRIWRRPNKETDNES